MSFIKDTFFGGAEKKAGQTEARNLQEAQQIIQQQTEQARGEALPLFNAAQQNLAQGFQGGLDVLGQTIPQQFQAFQGGNVAAQNALLAGLPQQQAAILGQQLDPNALQAQQLALPSFSTFRQQLPDFTTINQALGINQPQQNANPLLSGFQRGSGLGNFGNFNFGGGGGATFDIFGNIGGAGRSKF